MTRMALACSIPIAVASGLAALPGMLFGFSLKCDDSCGTAPPWRDDPGAWQWNALGYVAVTGALCGLLLVVLLVMRRRVLAGLTLTLWTACAVAFLKLFEDSGLTSNAVTGWYAIAILVLLGIVALARPYANDHMSTSLTGR
jgi:hypothetical protein